MNWHLVTWAMQLLRNKIILQCVVFDMNYIVNMTKIQAWFGLYHKGEGMGVFTQISMSIMYLVSGKLYILAISSFKKRLKYLLYPIC